MGPGVRPAGQGAPQDPVPLRPSRSAASLSARAQPAPPCHAAGATPSEATSTAPRAAARPRSRPAGCTNPRTIRRRYSALNRRRCGFSRTSGSGGPVVPLAETPLALRAYTPDPGLFRTERFGNFRYTIPVAAGRYRLKLYFAETSFGPANGRTEGVGARVFNVFCNGQTLQTAGRLPRGGRREPGAGEDLRWPRAQRPGQVAAGLRARGEPGHRLGSRGAGRVALLLI